MYEDLSPEGLVSAVCGASWRDLSLEQAKAIDHALRQHQQTIFTLDAALEEKVRRIVGVGLGGSVPVFMQRAGRLLRLR